MTDKVATTFCTFVQLHSLPAEICYQTKQMARELLRHTVTISESCQTVIRKENGRSRAEQSRETCDTKLYKCMINQLYFVLLCVVPTLPEACRGMLCHAFLVKVTFAADLCATVASSKQHSCKIRSRLRGFISITRCLPPCVW